METFHVTIRAFVFNRTALTPVWSDCLFRNITCLSALIMELPAWTITFREVNKRSATPEFQAIYGHPRFITSFTKTRHWSTSSDRGIQSTYYFPNSLKSILILSFHLRLYISSDLFICFQIQNQTCFLGASSSSFHVPEWAIEGAWIVLSV